MDRFKAVNLSDNERKDVAQLAELAVKVVLSPDHAVERMFDAGVMALLKERRDEMICAVLGNAGEVGGDIAVETFGRLGGLAANRLMVNMAGAQCRFELAAIPVIVLWVEDSRVCADFSANEHGRQALDDSFRQHGLLGEGDEVVIVPRLYSREFVGDASLSDIYHLAEAVCSSFSSGASVPCPESDAPIGGSELCYLIVGYLRANASVLGSGAVNYWEQADDAFDKRVQDWLDGADNLLAQCVGLEESEIAVGKLVHICGSTRAGENMFCDHMFYWCSEKEFEKAGVAGEDVDAHLERVGANGRLIAIDVTYRIRASGQTIGCFICPLPFHIEEDQEAIDFIMPILTDLDVRKITLCEGVKPLTPKRAEWPENALVHSDDGSGGPLLH